MKSILRFLGRPANTPQRRVVYTCLFGWSEPFADQSYEKDDRTDFICFTDDRNLKSNLWTFRHMDIGLLGPVRTSKLVKLLAYRFVGEYETSIYLDNTARLVRPVSEMFALLDQAASPMLCFKHPWRSCVYQEAEAVKAAGYDDAAVIDAQMEHYRSLGHPANAGLIAGGVLFRRHNDAVLQAVMEHWFHQVCLYSYRDQLSFNVIARMLGFAPDHLSGSMVDGKTVVWPTITAEKQLRERFGMMFYLALHEDVRQAGMNPREHYLKYGLHEGRAYLPPAD